MKIKKIKSKNKYLLVGKNGNAALQLLNDITSILDKYNIAYWLDFGTLLGIMRERRLLPWDDDIDISIFENDIDNFINNALPEIQKTKYRIVTKLIQTDIGFLKKDNIRVFKVKNKKSFFNRSNLLMDIFVIYKQQNNAYWISFNNLYTIPMKFLNDFDFIDFNSKKYRVPKSFDSCLTYHYGNWRIPDKDFDSRSIDVKSFSQKGI